jgi:hypothetical protein
MPYAIGIVLGLVVGVFTRATGFDRDRVLYPTIVIVVALYYVLFAVMGGSAQGRQRHSFAVGRSGRIGAEAR